MTGISSNPLALAALAGLASYFMTSMGLGLKKLRHRGMSTRRSDR
jgi:hypothetical protein